MICNCGNEAAVKMTWETSEEAQMAYLCQSCGQKVHHYCQMADKLEICESIPTETSIQDYVQAVYA